MAIRGGRELSGAIALVVATALILAGTSTASTYVRADPFMFGNSAFCSPGKPVRDFGLSRLPTVREAPEKGDLPFGPNTVSLVSLSGGRILPIGSDFGYELWSENQFGRTPIHWTARARIIGIDRKGNRGRVVNRKTVKVRTINNRTNVDLYLSPLRRPGSISTKSNLRIAMASCSVDMASTSRSSAVPTGRPGSVSAGT